MEVEMWVRVTVREDYGDRDTISVVTAFDMA